MAAKTDQRKDRRSRGFESAAGLLSKQIRTAGEGRGFAVARLLTHWAEIVGAEVAAMARPAKISYGREGFGATLTLLTTGAQAPMLQMRLPEVKDKVNACYGYAAISHIRITQVAPDGFADPPARFEPAPKEPSPEAVAKARAAAGDVEDTDLRAALENLGRNVMSKH
jgi:hypothetical protein